MVRHLLTHIARSPRFARCPATLCLSPARPTNHQFAQDTHPQFYPCCPVGVPYHPLTLTVIVELSTLRYNALKNFKQEFPPRYISPLVDAYNRFFGVLHGDQLSCCKTALKNARLCRKNHQIWENRNYDDGNNFVFLRYKRKCYLELMVHIDGQKVVYDPVYDPGNVYDHRYLSFRHKFSHNIDIDRSELSQIEDKDVPQPNSGLSSDNECVADICLGLLIVINHLNMCQIKNLSEAFGHFGLQVLSVNAPRMGGRWGYEPPRRQLRSVRTLPCKNESGGCLSVCTR